VEILSHQTPSAIEIKRSVAEPSLPVIGSYTDYRLFLKDFYEFRKFQTRKDRRPYSYAMFSAAADIRSPNYLKLVIEGKRNLSEAMGKKFAKAMNLSKAETDEFLALVRFTQTENPLERNQKLKELSDLRVGKKLKTGEINQDTWEKVPSWVAWVLHALTDQKDVSADFESLYGHLRRKAKPDVVRKSLERLMESGELARGEDGSLQKGRLLMSGSENVPVDLVRKIQSELIYLGLESLAQDPPQDREFGAMTVALTEEEFENLKFELRQFRKRWTKDIMVKRQESKGDRVFQLNIQLFPVSEK
tara:strand:- start:1087 stop:1998 length:912 start_codon:yes stop_codon:yes gene_type:complete